MTKHGGHWASNNLYTSNVRFIVFTAKTEAAEGLFQFNKNIPSIYMNALGLFEAKFGTLSKTPIAAVLDNWPPSCRESRSIRMAADEESHENRVDTASTAD
jgi:hypothetical protein